MQLLVNEDLLGYFEFVLYQATRKLWFPPPWMMDKDQYDLYYNT